MLSLSSSRRLSARPVWMGRVALTALLAAAVPQLADGSPATVQRGPALASHPSGTSARSGGYVITRDQLDLEQDYPLSSILIAHIPGIRVVHDGALDRVLTSIHISITDPPCYAQVYVDGVFINGGDVAFITVSDLDSIEYHTPGNIPVQFQNRRDGAACGVLLFWSKTSV